MRSDTLGIIVEGTLFMLLYAFTALACLTSLPLAADMVNFDMHYVCSHTQEIISDRWMDRSVERETCNATILLMNHTAITWFYSPNLGRAASMNRSAPMRNTWTFNYGSIPPFSYIRIEAQVASDRYFVFAEQQSILQNALQHLMGSSRKDTIDDWKSMKNVVVLQGNFGTKATQSLVDESVIVITDRAVRPQSFIVGAEAIAMKNMLLKKLQYVPVQEMRRNLPVSSH